MKKALIWVQHLLGTGHTVRAAAIGHALRRRDVAVTLVLGAAPPSTVDLSGLSVVRLPAVLASDGSFQEILTETGAPYETVADERRTRLLSVLHEVEPDIVLTETFPFGRRKFAPEALPLVAAARAMGALVATSVRDVLVRKPPDKEAAMVAIAQQHYDAILVHADPHVVRLDDSFAMAGDVASLTHYTGFVDGGGQMGERTAREGIVVSAGGSGVGRSLMAAAVEAAGMGDTTIPWRILVPPALEEVSIRWRTAASPNLRVEPNRPDFRQLLAGAALSVSQAGYNTVLDVLAAGPRSILVPFAAHEETEQTDRAHALAARGRATVLPEREVTAARLHRAVEEALRAPIPVRETLDMDGAQNSASILLDLLR